MRIDYTMLNSMFPLWKNTLPMLHFDPTEVVLFSLAWFVGLLGQMFSELCPIPSSPLPFLCPPAWLSRASTLLFDGKLLWKGTWNPQCLQAQGAGSAWEFTSSQGRSLTNDWQMWSINIFVLWPPSRDDSEMCVLYCFSMLSHCTNSHLPIEMTGLEYSFYWLSSLPWWFLPSPTLVPYTSHYTACTGILDSAFASGNTQTQTPVSYGQFNSSFGGCGLSIAAEVLGTWSSPHMAVTLLTPCHCNILDIHRKAGQLRSSLFFTWKNCRAFWSLRAFLCKVMQLIRSRAWTGTYVCWPDNCTSTKWH